MSDKLSPIQEEILKRADSIFNSISISVTKATEFASEQLPDIAMQYVAFGRAYDTFIISCCIIVITTFILWLHKLGKRSKTTEMDAVIMLFGGTSAIIAVFTGIINAKSFFLVWFTPKIWLIT